MQWYKIELVGEQIAHLPSIVEEFTLSATKQGELRDAGLFRTEEAYIEKPRGISLVIFIYVSPKAAVSCPTLISKYSATSCDKPDAGSVFLFAGYPDALSQ